MLRRLPINDGKIGLKRRLFLHLGLSKTGTTSIQSFLRGNADVLAAHGAVYPDLGGERSSHPALAPSVLRPNTTLDINHAALALEIRKRGSASIGQETPTPLWSGVFERIASANAQTAIISYENFYNRPDLYEFNSLAAQLEKFDVHGVIYLRPPEDWFSSLYSQTVKGRPRTTASFADFSSQRTKFAIYSKILDDISTYMPINHLIVGDFEKASTSGLLIDFLIKIGLPGDLSISAQKQAMVNRSLPHWATLFLLKCNRDGMSDETFIRVRRMLARMKSDEGPRLRPGLDVATPEEREDLRAAAAADAGRLGELYGVTLTQRAREPLAYRPFDDEDVDTIREALAGKIPQSDIEPLAEA